MLIGASRARSGNYRIILQYGLKQLRLMVLRHTEADSPEVVVNDAQSVNSGKFEDALKALLKPYEKLKLEQSPVELVLDLGRYQSVMVEKPNLPEQDMASGLAFQLGDLVEFEPDAMSTDFYELPYHAAGKEKIAAVVADKKMLSDIVLVLQEQDLNITAISISELHFKKLQPVSDKALLALYPVSSGGYLVQIYQKGMLCFSRALHGLKAIDAYSQEEIELGALEPMATELQRSMDYFESQLRQATIKQVSLALKHPHLSLVKQTLQELLAVDVAEFQYASWMSELAEGDFSDISLFAAAVPEKQEQDVS